MVSDPSPRGLRRYLSVFAWTRQAVSLVWQTNPRLTGVLAVLTVLGGLLPPATAWVGKLVVDAVVAKQGTAAVGFVALEALLVVAMAGAQRGLDVSNSLLRVQLGHRVNVLILDKALELDLTHFEDSETYDRMTQARREASSRPLSLVQRSFGLVQNGLSLVTYGALLLRFSPWAVLVLLLASIPAFVAETRFAGQAFRLFRWRSPETRKQAYLEVVVAREDHAKEVKLLELGPRLVGEYKRIFETVYAEDRDLTLRRGAWGFGLGLLSTAALYGAYAWTALTAVAGRISLGDMTMYLLVFKQGQSAFSSLLRAIAQMYEDNLYVANLYEFLDIPVARAPGTVTAGPVPGDGFRVEHVSFTYPGSTTPALDDVSLHIRPGVKLALVGHNGSGKTTLIKLLAGLYVPDAGRITLDGLDLAAWDPHALRRRIGVIFQDFVRYQFTVGENIGVGDVPRIEDEVGWRRAADKGMALPAIERLPEGFATQLGRWFHAGQELSMGQWQKVALARAFMREQADILVLDEPTAAMDAEAEAEIFDRFRAMTDDQMAILISHRFSTVRMADEIVVLDQGRVVEQGDHDALMAEDGRYAHLFSLQAAGYR